MGTAPIARPCRGRSSGSIGRLVGAAAALVALSAHATVELDGIEGAKLMNVEAYLSLDGLECSASQADVRQEYQAAPAEIRDALAALGYYAPTIDASLDLDGDCWQARITIDAGPRTMVRTFEFRVAGAADDRVFAAIAAAPGIAVGDGLDQGRYDALKRRLLDAARDRGYPEARFTASRIDVYPEAQAADIDLEFETGPRYDFGQVEIDQDALADRFVRRFVDIEPGRPFSNAALASTYVSLTDSGYFDTIDVRALQPDAAAHTIPVRVSLVASPRLRINYGVGFSTDTGPRVRIGRMIRRFNDRGHQLGVQSQLSPVVSEVTANYRYPYGDPRSEWASFDGGIKREETDSATSESLEFGARRVLERARGWSRTQFLNALVEDYDVADQVGRSRLLMPGMNWTHLRADNTLRPSRGDKLDIEIRGAADAFGSDTSFIQTVLDYKIIRSFGHDGRLLARTSLGATADDRFEDLPPSVRFFAGGDNSIRGYGFEALGPMDASGDVIGGSRLAVASIEYEHPVRPKWSIATFIDAGNAFKGHTIDVKRSAGIGARWLSPLGPIRVDVGFPIGDPDAGPRLHISLGPDL